MAEIFVYPEDFLFPEDRSFTTGDQTPLDRSVCDDREQDFSAHQNHHDNHDENSTLSTGTTRHLQQQRQQQHMNHAVRLPEEPPLVPPSLFGDDGEAGIEFRSSFLFQSSCYLPDDESESDCSPVEVKKSPLQRHETIKPWKPNLPDQLEGSADQTGSTSSDENVRVAKRLMDRFEPSSRKRTWKDPRHHHIEFRSNQSIHNVSVSDKTRKIDPSYRGYRIYIPGAGNNQGDGHDNLSIDPMDDFTVPEALTRAGMSTLSFDADRFFGFAIPQTNKHRWACGMVIVSFLAAVAAVSATCGMGYCTGQRSSALRPTSNPSSTPPETDTDLGGGTAMPTSSPSLLILPPPPTPGRIAFQSNVELNRAVDDYLAGDSSKSSTVAQEYGHPIGVWNVQYLTNFSHVFDARRNPLAATFNEDLNSWNVARATTMEGMFFGAETFNGNISSWNTGSVTKMKELLSKAGSFKGDLSQWDVSSVISMEGMCKLFLLCSPSTI